MKNNYIKHGLVAGVAALSVFTAAAQSAGVVSPVQSKADPYGLKIAGPVMQSGSDESHVSADC
jgi:hypothetical protein